MGDRSTIEWTDATWNPVTGCSKVSPGCAHCYAEAVSHRFATAWGSSPLPWTPANAADVVRLHPERLDQPFRWRRPRMVFVNSMSDLFHDQVPFEYVDRVFAVIEECPRHVFQVLTKRPERMRDYFMSRTKHPLDNSALKAADPILYQDVPQLWLGVSIENAHHTYRADILRDIPAAVRFISAEPLLGSLMVDRHAGRPDGDCSEQCHHPLNLAGIDWLIAGGESGPHARPMRLEWARELRDACQNARVAFFLKQLGGHPDKRGSANAVLDGRTWTEMPTPDTGADR